jgi:hypothetical protein
MHVMTHEHVYFWFISSKKIVIIFEKNTSFQTSQQHCICSVWYPMCLDNTQYIEIVFNQVAPDYLEELLPYSVEFDVRYVWDESRILRLCVVTLCTLELEGDRPIVVRLVLCIYLNCNVFINLLKTQKQAVNVSDWRSESRFLCLILM